MIRVAAKRFAEIDCIAMRSSIITLVLGIAVLASTSGCYSFHDVSYPGRGKPVFWPKDIHIDAYDKRALAVTLILPATNLVSFAVLPSKSSLTDKRNLHYRLEFEPIVAGGSDTNEGLRSHWYYVRAYGPAPSTSQRFFHKGSYNISVAYTANGEPGIIHTEFVIDRYSIPFFVVWFGWLTQGGPP